MEPSWRPDLSLSLAIASSEPSAAGMMLREIAWNRVDLVAEKMKTMREDELEEIKHELCSILNNGLRNWRHADELKHLQNLVQSRVDLTQSLLQIAHHLQLAILVAIKTGEVRFIDGTDETSPNQLQDALLGRCRNFICITANLDPFDDNHSCECDICSMRDGFCRKCTCMICEKFDQLTPDEFNSCRWVRCDACAHLAHMDCAVNADLIDVDLAEIGFGIGKTVFYCLACEGKSEVLKLVREIFKKNLNHWEQADLLRECGFVCKIFDESDDAEERSFFRKCAEIHASLSTGSGGGGYSLWKLEEELREMQYRENMHEALERILINTSVEPIEMSFEFLQCITNEFSDSKVIGRGGFGVVYMGFLKDMKIAVKKLSQTMDFSDKQFKDELACLRRVKHNNIVRFLGYCSDIQVGPIEYKGRVVMAEERRRFLCFKYVPNTLHDYIKAESDGDEKYDTHYKLLEGICYGLRYLHNEERITHLDLKPENILVDADKIPKITDFGLSRRFSGGQSKIITKNVLGSQGYVAPEYWNKGEISYKADIFSLGIIIRKLFCGSTDLSDFENWYQSLHTVSPQVKRCFEISKLCVDDDPRKRPTIDSLIDMLSKVTIIDMPIEEKDIWDQTLDISEALQILVIPQ
ncbi:hypothetical protein ACP4OV_002358 [Aristida adscensionis]